MASTEGHPAPLGAESWDDDMWETYHAMCDAWKRVLHGRPTDMVGMLEEYTVEHGLSRSEAVLVSYKSLCGLLGARTHGKSIEN